MLGANTTFVIEFRWVFVAYSLVLHVPPSGPPPRYHVVVAYDSGLRRGGYRAVRRCWRGLGGHRRLHHGQPLLR